MISALVTGSAGFVGRHMVRLLDKRSYRVVRVDIETGIDALEFFRGQRDAFRLRVPSGSCGRWPDEYRGTPNVGRG